MIPQKIYLNKRDFCSRSCLGMVSTCHSTKDTSLKIWLASKRGKLSKQTSIKVHLYSKNNSEIHLVIRSTIFSPKAILWFSDYMAEIKIFFCSSFKNKQKNQRFPKETNRPTLAYFIHLPNRPNC